MSSNIASLLDIPEELARLEAEIAALRFQQLELIGALDRELPSLGFPDAAREELAVACRISAGEAQHRLNAARAVTAPDGREPRLLQTAQALAAGEIGVDHAVRIAEATDVLDRDSARWVETQVLGDDRARTPGQFAHRARKAALAVGADRRERAAREMAKRELLAHEYGGRVTFSWTMPSLDAALVQAWVDEHAIKQGPDDLRLGAERRGDALFGLVEDAMRGVRPVRAAGVDSPSPVRTPGSPAAQGIRRSASRLDVIVTLDMLTSGMAPRPGVPVPRRSLARAGVGAGLERGDRWGGDPTNRLDGRSVFGDQLRRFSCDNDVRVTLINGDGCVVDQGRTTRVVSSRLRGLLELRDQHCRGIGCRVPARHCDAHHSVPWAVGGRTDLSNLVLLCRRHHHLAHEGGWSLDLFADGSVEWQSPAGQVVREHAELDTLHLAPPEAGAEDDHPDGRWIRPWWEELREPAPTPEPAEPPPAAPDATSPFDVDPPF